jgi:hypothetical protein
MARDPDLPLSFLWSGITEDHLALVGFAPTNKEGRRIARRAIVTNLMLADASGQWVSYSRNRNHYTGQSRYQGLAYTYANVLDIVEELRARQFIEEDRAPQGRLGWQSRIRATPDLIAALGRDLALTLRPGELVRLKDGAKRLIDYTETDFTKSARAEVANLNEAFESLSLSVCAPDVRWDRPVVRIDDQFVHMAQITGHRVFNCAWDFGGRLYGPFWQTLPSRRRDELTIGGEPVTEHDFPQLHPRLLYAEVGRRLDYDAYTIAGYEERRDQVKKAWQMLINARSHRSAIRALANELGGTHFQRQASEILKALQEHHKPIAPAFYTCAAGRLQRRDSDLMMRITSRCLSEGFVVLPVHDSFIAQRGRRAERTLEIMEDELAQLLTALC